MLPDHVPVLVHCHVTEWTSTYTAFALDAILVGVEVFVGDEKTVEERSQHIGFDPCAPTSYHLSLFLSACDAFGDGGKMLEGFLHLGLCHLVLVHIESW